MDKIARRDWFSCLQWKSVKEIKNFTFKSVEKATRSHSTNFSKKLWQFTDIEMKEDRECHGRLRSEGNGMKIKKGNDRRVMTLKRR